jgi:hypothetical protein
MFSNAHPQEPAMSLCRSTCWPLALFLLMGCGNDPASELGKTCTLGFDSPGKLAYNPQAPECSVGLCLKPVLSNSRDLDTAPYCTTTCADDGDCHGQKRDGDDPDDHRCVTGYTCGVAVTVGPLCCQKVCLCKDFIGDRGVTTPTACQAGASGQTLCTEGR